MKINNTKIIIFSFVFYFLGVLVIFFFNLTKTVIVNYLLSPKKLTSYEYIKTPNYISILDLNQANFISLRDYFKNTIFVSLYDKNKIYFNKIDLYGNIISTKAIPFNEKLSADYGLNLNIELNYSSKYSFGLIDSVKNFLINFDYNANFVSAYEIKFNNHGDEINNITTIYLDSKNIGFLIDKKYIFLGKIKGNSIKPNIQLKSEQDLEFVVKKTNNPILTFNLPSNLSTFIVDLQTLKQYIIKNFNLLDSEFFANQGYLILTNDNNYYLSVFSIMDKRIMKNFQIQYPYFADFKLSSFKDKLIVYYSYSNNFYFCFIDSDYKINKTIKISGINNSDGFEFKLFSNSFGIFILSRYKNFPFILKIDEDVQNYNFYEVNISSENDENFSLNQYNLPSVEEFDLLTKYKGIDVILEKIELNSQEEDVFLKMYSVF